MKIVFLQGWILKIDAVKTREYYNSITVEEGCNCDYCKNYIKNCENFSREVLNFYNMLEIDIQKEGEFMECYKTDTKEHLYMGFYHLVGEIVKKPGDGTGKWNYSNILKDDLYDRRCYIKKCFN